MPKRFEILTAEEVVQRGLDRDEEWVWGDASTDWNGYLLDNKKNCIVFSDAGEPEDMTLGRDLGVFVDILNDLAESG